MFDQKDSIPNFIFPIVIATQEPSTNSYIYNELIGTAFFIGNSGWALTCAHLIDQFIENKNDSEFVRLVAIFQASNLQWHAFEVMSFEKHLTEDIAIMKIEGEKWTSFFRIDETSHNSSREYHCWGYPYEIAKELQHLYEYAMEYPQLIFTKGYVRRRISRELYPVMIFKGNQFYELSEQIGQGASGAPLILHSSIGSTHWQVFGIYIGEKEGGNVAYAVRAEAFSQWEPNILKKRIIDEANQS